MSVTTKTMAPNIGLEAGKRQAVAERLLALLADEYVLYTKTRNFHWNVVGPNFAPAHAFLEKQYDALAERLDEVAERARQLGLPASGSLREFLDASRLKEAAGAEIGDQDAFKLLLSDHEAIVRALREDVGAAGDAGDEGTADFLTGLMEAHEKDAWMLRSHLA